MLLLSGNVFCLVVGIHLLLCIPCFTFVFAFYATVNSKKQINLIMVLWESDGAAKNKPTELIARCNTLPLAASSVASPTRVHVTMSVWIGLPESSRSVTRDTAFEPTAEAVVAADAAETPAAHARLEVTTAFRGQGLTCKASGQGLEVRRPVAVLGFSFLAATGVATLSAGGHSITNTLALNYRVCNVILASSGLILNFFGGQSGARNFTGGCSPPGPPRTCH